MRKLKLDELNRLSTEDYRDAPKHPVVVVLDNIRSRLNVGAVFRNCDAFRIEKLYLCGYTPPPPHRDIAKTALGAEMSVEWEVQPDPAELARSLKARGYALVAVEQTDASVPLHGFRLPDRPVAVILGNEVEGVQEAVVRACDHAVEITQFGTKHSLNIAVACGIVLHSFVMQLQS